MKRREAFTYLLLTIAAYLALYYTIPYIALKSKLVMLVIMAASTIIFMGLQIAIIRWAAEVRLGWKAALPLFLISLMLLSAIISLVASAQHDKLLHMMKDPAGLAQLKAQKSSIKYYMLLYSHYRGPLIPVINLLLISSATWLGCFVSFLLKEKNIVLPVAAFAAFIDIWTVSVGPTSKMLKHTPQVVQAVSAQIPAPGAGHIAPLSFIGPGDFLFLAMLFAAICRLGMNARRTFWFVFPILTLGMLWVIMGGSFFGLPVGFPALVLVALGVVLANLGDFKLQKSEIKAIIAVAGLVLSAALILAFFLTKKP